LVVREGIARLTAVTAELGHLTVDGLCDQLVERIVRHRSDDDIAIVAVRCHPQDALEPMSHDQPVGARGCFALNTSALKVPGAERVPGSAQRRLSPGRPGDPEKPCVQAAGVADLVRAAMTTSACTRASVIGGSGTSRCRRGRA
jgi:hypothetical protein